MLPHLTVRKEVLGHRVAAAETREASAGTLLPDAAEPVREPQAERRVVVRAVNLGKVFTSSFTARKKWAVRGLNLEVFEKEVFGFLGPNGAGKTTTIKLLLGLLRPTYGSIEIFGTGPASPASRAQVGFLPENPSFYDYLKLGEFLRLCASLSGLRRRREVERRVAESLFVSGLIDHEDVQMRKFSKGMLQRAGLAQALVNNPRLLILDEPMSGLDPIGRKEFRDSIVRARENGMTVFFSSHIIADVELLCDRVGIINNGVLEKSGPIGELVQQEVRSVEIVARDVAEQAAVQLEPFVEERRTVGDAVVLRLRDELATTLVLGTLASSGARILSVTPHKETLESVFVRQVTRSSLSRASGADGTLPGEGRKKRVFRREWSRL
ncbi:MAG: ABC transporter ATP-binding protein [Candidatus Eisenbacteria bacterium]|nr:ABC transporter ATP-binding protein [Candidatus Eisenbacteria bacterium]